MFQWLKQLFCKIFRRGRSDSSEENETLSVLAQEPHSCALVALARAIPDLPAQDIIEAFVMRCDKWPEAGVSNSEFNKVLHDLKVFDRFHYDGADTTIEELIKQPKKLFIALIHGHFTVVQDGVVRDSPYNLSISTDTAVYCSWELRSHKFLGF